MANELYIEEYQGLLTQAGMGSVPVATGLLNTQKVAVSASSSQSAALSSKAKFALVTSDVAAQFEMGDNPTADGDSRYLPADAGRFIAVKGGQKIAVIEQQ